jgi:hypothetical protein
MRLRGIRTLGVIVSVISAGLWCCKSENGVIVYPQADAGAALDAGKDAARKRDTGVTTEPADASPEPPIDAAKPGSPLLQRGTWKPIPGINNPNCLIAENAAEAVPPLEWQPCANNRAGCKKLKKTWTKLPGAGFGVAGYGSPRIVKLNGKAFLFHQMGMPDAGYRVDDGEYLNVVRTLDGVAVSATFHKIGGTNTCSARTLSTDGKTVAYQGFQRPPPRSDGPIDPFVLRFDGATINVALMAEGAPQLGGYIGTSTARTYHQLYAGGWGIYNPTTKAWAQKDGTLATVSFEAPLGVVGGAMGTASGLPVGLIYTDDDGNWTRVTSPVGERYATGMALDRENQNRMYWIESNALAGDATSSILYSAPFAKTAAELAAKGGPKRITELGPMNGRGGADMLANAGVAIDLLAWDKAFAIRDSDGKGWSIPADPGEIFAQGMWVDDNEVWLATGAVPQGSTANNGYAFEGIMVIQRSSLGAPDLMPK